jgi:hypothetical protein
MEYLFGAIVTATTIFFTYRWFVKTAVPRKSIKIAVSQSRTNELFKKIFMPDQSFPKATSQAMKDFDAKSTRVLIIDNEAYWIKNNTVFMAEVINGEVEKETTREVDTMAMDKVQLKKMIFIVEKLKEGL